MFQITKREELNPTVTRISVQAPRVAKKALPGQFIILRVDENGERIPLTVADTDPVAGTVTVIFQVVGASTEQLNHIPEGGCIHDFVGPLGVPTKIAGLKKVAVVGGGDTACEEATYLASICKQVYLIVRKPFLRASKAMQERVFNTPNIKVMFEYNTVEVLGDEDGVTGARLRHASGEETTIDIMGFFLAIGHHPNTELFKGKLELDEEGYIKTIPGTSKTNIEGVFAAGDVKDPHYRQAITAAGSGCIAALDCERYLLSK